ncbi:MAG: peptidoglycan -binding protein [Rhodospirillales bacterium]|nr:peptidoglycan -binding protein [Rhodospirillales bacterium]MDH3790657.1 peptidoglycan -binding protein [Rhodospirillales bacterium]MDH3919032.1 peptidoglycan -binding protein [Rhodospirillales bacterium]
MYALGRGGRRRAINIWPGFVDGLATLLLVVIFVLMVFMVAQYFLSTALTGKDQALQRLERQVSELADLLSLERAGSAELRINVAQLSSELQSSLSRQESLSAQLAALAEERDTLESALTQAEARSDRVSAELEDAYKTIEADKEKIEVQLAELAMLKALRDELTAKLATSEDASAKVAADLEDAYKVIDADKEKIQSQLAELAILKSLRDELTQQLNAAEAALAARDKEATELESRLAKSEEDASVLALKLSTTEQARDAQVELSTEAQRKVDLLNRQILALREQLARLSEALDLAEAKTRDQNVQIADLGRKLNLALATKVQELARYRSEFFGRLRKVLGDHPGIRVVGDRFVFQSEVLFGSGSAELGEAGRQQLAQLARTLRQISARFPEKIDWILRVDGHTDRRPINTYEFASNWELSTARAISVVKYLVVHGIPARRLAATGFGEFQPIDDGEDEIAFRRNRRIELKLTQR